MSGLPLEGCDEDTLNRITLVLHELSKHFDVSFRHAAMRAVGLELITKEQWTGIQELAHSEAVHRALMRE
jgi:Zn-dependent peptidase ImmA (M78 family)